MSVFTPQQVLSEGQRVRIGSTFDDDSNNDYWWARGMMLWKRCSSGVGEREWWGDTLTTLETVQVRVGPEVVSTSMVEVSDIRNAVKEESWDGAARESLEDHEAYGRCRGRCWTIRE